MNKAQWGVESILLQSFGWSLDEPPGDVPTGTHCVMSGEPISLGYAVRDVISSNAGAPLDMVYGVGMAGYMSPDAATVFRCTSHIGSVLAIEGEPGLRPLISRESAAAGERPCWSDLIRDVWPRYAGRRCVCVIATDFKKRVIHRAQVGVLGDEQPVYVLDANAHLDGNVALRWNVLLEVLSDIEQIYDAGFSKRSISSTLWREFNKAQQVGMDKVAAMERRLDMLRQMSEFLPALIVAQRSVIGGSNEQPA